MNTAYQFLHFVQYAAIRNWSVQYMIGGNFGYSDKYPLARIGSFLKRSRNVIDIEDEVEYKQVTVRTNNGGVCLRDKKRGKDIGTKKQNRVSKGQYIVSKIDARNGAFGIIPNELDGAIVTNDFPVFDVDNTIINTEFLLLVTTTKPFVAFAQSCSSGTTNRRRIDIDKFLEQEIPLPSLEEQNILVSAYSDIIGNASSLQQSIVREDEEWKCYVRNSLFTDRSHEKEKRAGMYLQFIHFKEVTEWGIEKIKKRAGSGLASKYDILHIKDVCKVNSGGTPSRSNKSYYQGNIPWIKTGEVLNEIIYDTEEHISEDAISHSSARVYPKGSLIIAMYGQGDTRGRTAKLGVDASTNQACAVLHHIDNGVILTDYLWDYIQSMYDDLRSLASGTNQPNLNAEKIKNYMLPIPPKEIQEGIVSYVSAAKARIHELQTKAASLKVQALQDFEHALFKQ